MSHVPAPGSHLGHQTVAHTSIFTQAYHHEYVLFTTVTHVAANFSEGGQLTVMNSNTKHGAWVTCRSPDSYPQARLTKIAVAVTSMHFSVH